MNKRIKKKRRNEYNWTTTKERKRNKEFCKKYPFMIPRDDVTGKMYWLRKPYDIVETFGVGWDKAFREQLCEELREELIRCNYLYEFRPCQIKEKYGQLRFYHNGVPLDCKVDNIIDDYSILSENICYFCGKPDVSMTNTGWILPVCKECFIEKEKRKNNYRTKKLSEEDILDIYHKVAISEPKMADSRIVTRYTKTGGDEIITYDLTDKANKIRENFIKKMT